MAQLKAVEKPEMSISEARRLAELNKTIAKDIKATSLKQDAMDAEEVALLANNE